MKRRQWFRFVAFFPFWTYLASAAIAVPFFAAPDNLVKNSSFEQPSIASQKLIGRPSDWKVTSTKAGDILRPGIRIRKVSDAPDGNQVVELNSVIRVKVSQKLSVLPHATYKVSWMQKTVQSIYETTFSGVETDTAVLGGTECEPLVSEWYQCSYNVTIDDSDEVALFIQAENTGSYGNLIDDVQVVLLSVPQPSPTKTTSGTPTPSPIVDPTTIIETPTATPTPTASVPSADPSPSQSKVGPSPSDVTLPTLLPTALVPFPTPDVTDPTSEPTPSDVIDVTSISQEDQQAIDQANADGVLTNEEKQQLADILVETYANDASIPFAVMEKSGLDYQDLPPEQPVSLENGVVLTASVVDALEIFKSPTEVLTTILKNPKKTIKAIANIGADLRPKVRHEAQRVVVSGIIVVQVIGGAVTTLVRKP